MLRPTHQARRKNEEAMNGCLVGHQRTSGSSEERSEGKGDGAWQKVTSSPLPRKQIWTNSDL